MTYEQAFADALASHCTTGQRRYIWKFIWTGDYAQTAYLLPLTAAFAVCIGEVNRRTPR